MKYVVLDTNILLDIFIFNDARAVDLKAALLSNSITAVASQKTLAEFADVISRPLFKLERMAQIDILKQWQLLAEHHDDLELIPAPWQCQDADDQIFLDLAYKLRPALLISKDNAVLELASQAAKDDILITNDYNAFKL
jgi:putative PIN family toxin of toxin-antitoxin system